MSELLPDLYALARENAELQLRLQEAEELISAIRTGAVDALAVQGPDGPRIFTLQGADQGYRTLIEQMTEGALLLSADATILYCNACLADMLGRPLEALMGNTLDSFVPADFKFYWGALLAKGWTGKSKGELPLRAQTGELVPSSLSMNVLEFNDTAVLAVIVTNLSAQEEVKAIQAIVTEQNAVIDRKNQELETQEAARRAGEQAAAEANRMLEGIPQIAWTANAEGANTYFNHRWFDYTNQRHTPLLDSLWATHLHPADAGPTEARWQHSLRTGHAFEVEFRLRNATGDYRWMLGRALPSRNERGEVMQWIGTYTDIHEHKLALERIDQAQRELQENNQQLLRANVDLDNFIYTASHDLKAPISNIEGLLDALLTELPTEYPAASEVPYLLQLIQDSVNRFKQTIDHLTEVSKLQKEYTQPAESVQLAEVVRGVCLDLYPLIQTVEAQLDVQIPADLTVSFPEKNLRSVVYNLLSNALKYRDPSRVSHVRLHTRPEGPYLVLTVEDNGLGLDVAHTQKLFGMFQRFHDHVEGSGIGLYMVKRMVENAGGRIKVQSEVGRGSAFSVYFSQ